MQCEDTMEQVTWRHVISKDHMTHKVLLLSWESVGDFRLQFATGFICSEWEATHNYAPAIIHDNTIFLLGGSHNSTAFHSHMYVASNGCTQRCTVCSTRHCNTNRGYLYWKQDDGWWGVVVYYVQLVTVCLWVWQWMTVWQNVDTVWHTIKKSVTLCVCLP